MDVLIALIVVVVLVAAARAWLKSEARKRRCAALLAKYGDPAPRKVANPAPAEWTPPAVIDKAGKKAKKAK